MSAAMATCLSAVPTICSSSRAAPVAHCGVSQPVLLPSARTAFRGGRIAAPSTGCTRRQIDTTCRAVRQQTSDALSGSSPSLAYLLSAWGLAAPLLWQTDAVPASAQLTQTVAAPLVGNVAPDFTAQAVFDQEFQEISLSSYRGKARVSSVVRPALS
jgi:hypothetical protein